LAWARERVQQVVDVEVDSPLDDSAEPDIDHHTFAQSNSVEMNALVLVIGIRGLDFGPDNLGAGYMIDQGNTLVAAAAKAGGPAANYFAKVAVAVVHLVLG
jgi:hypothetical protein